MAADKGSLCVPWESVSNCALKESIKNNNIFTTIGTHICLR